VLPIMACLVIERGIDQQFLIEYLAWSICVEIGDSLFASISRSYNITRDKVDERQGNMGLVNLEALDVVRL